jgi:hypothetical protein
MDAKEALMKLFRNTIVLLILLCLTAGAYLFYSNKEPVHLTEDAKFKITDTIDKADVSELSIQYEKENLVFTIKDGKWICIAPEGFKFKEYELESVFNSLGGLTADAVVEEEAGDFEQYGLTSPQCIVSIHLKSGTSYTLEIGDLTPSRGGRYLKLKNSPKVFLTSLYIPTKYEFADNMLLTIKPEEITAFSLEKAGAIVFKGIRQGAGKWTIVSPVECEAAPNFDSIVSKAATIIIHMIVDDKPENLGEYGLLTPGYGIELESSEKKVKLLIGNEVASGSQVYAKLADNPEVFIINQDFLNFIDTGLSDVINRVAYPVDVDDRHE